jgi:hypothetical protein
LRRKILGAQITLVVESVRAARAARLRQKRKEKELNEAEEEEMEKVRMEDSRRDEDEDEEKDSQSKAKAADKRVSDFKHYTTWNPAALFLTPPQSYRSVPRQEESVDEGEPREQLVHKPIAS